MAALEPLVRLEQQIGFRGEFWGAEGDAQVAWEFGHLTFREQPFLDAYLTCGFDCRKRLKGQWALDRSILDIIRPRLASQAPQAQDILGLAINTCKAEGGRLQVDEVLSQVG